MLKIILLVLFILLMVALTTISFVKRAIGFWFSKAKPSTKVLATVGTVLVAIAISLLVESGVVLILHIALFNIIFELVVRIGKLINKNKALPVTDKLCRCGALQIIAAVIVFIWGHANIDNFQRTDYKLTTTKNIGEDCRVLLLADLHYGSTLTYDELSGLVDELNDVSADMILLCGDIVDENTTALQVSEVFGILSQLKSTYGTYYTFGNHDKSSSTSPDSYTTSMLRNIIIENNIEILEDTYVSAGAVTLVGRVDNSEPRESVDLVLEDIDKNSYTIVMDHQPVEYEAYAEAGVDLEVSGHTHGGQVWPIGWLIVPLGFTDSYYGLTTIEDFNAIVTSGLSGWGFTVRTEKPSEYVVIDICGAD